MPNISVSDATLVPEVAGLLNETADHPYIATEILPVLPVDREEGFIYQLPLDQTSKELELERAKATGYAKTDVTLTKLTYAVKEYGLEQPMDDRELAELSKSIPYMQMLGKRTAEQLRKAEEKRVKNLIHNTTTYPLSGNTGLGISNEWDDATNADPVADIKTGRNAIYEKSGFLPNTLQIAWQTFYDLWNCDRLQDARRYVQLADIPPHTSDAARNALAQLLGVEKILVGAQFGNVTSTGVTEIWSDEYAFLFYRNPTNDLQAATLGYTYSYTSDGGMFVAERYRDEPRRAEILRVRQSVSESLTIPELGFLFGNVATN